MAEGKETVSYYYNILESVNYRFNDEHGLIYLTQDSYENLLDALSNLRSLKEIDGHCYHVIRKIFKHHYDNEAKIRRLDQERPRVIAQKFIGKRKVREFIFKRDGYKCLCCGSLDKLQIDHIIPVNKGGENKLSNLQTLCNSCNSRKRDNFKDYRNERI